MRPNPQYLNDAVRLRRHTLMRLPFFVPDEQFNQLVGYLLGYVSRKYEVSLSAGCVALDRVALIGDDPECDRSRFSQEFHSLLARALNRMMGREDAPVFGPPPGDSARLCDQEAVLEEIVECLVMPVADGLVEQGRKWLGLRFGPESWGKEQVYARPDFFFSEEMPETTSFTPVRPKGFEERSDAELAEHLRREIRREEERLRQEHEAAGREFPKPKEVLKIERGVPLEGWPSVRPAWQPFRASDPTRREQEEERYVAFLSDHEVERQKMLADDVPNTQVCFPEGTYWWRRFSSFDCEERVEREPFAPP